MDMMSTGPAIEGCEDPWEELALAFCLGARAEAAELSRFLSLQSVLEGLRQQGEAARARVESARQAHATAVAQFDSVKKLNLTDPLILIGATLMLGGVIVAALGTMIMPPLALLGCLMSPAGLVLVILKSVAHFKARKAAQEAAAATEASLGKADSDLADIVARAAAIKKQLQSLNPKKSVRGVGRAYFPAMVVKLGGHSVALDRSGVVRPRHFKLAEFDFSSTELRDIVTRIDALRNPPVLLAADEAASGRIDELHGEEQGLRDTVERFSEFVGRIPTTELDLPVIRNRSSVARELASGRAPEPVFPGAILLDGQDAERARAVGKLNATMGTAKSRGAAPKVELLGAYQSIAHLLEQYRSLRTTSMSAIHQQFMDAMSRSSWCKVRFYCPKATRNPVWTLRRLGVDIPTAHQRDQSELLVSLSADPDIEARLAERPELEPDLSRAWIGIRNVESDIDRLRAGAAVAASGTGVAATAGPATIAGSLRYLESQLQQYLAEYRAALNVIIFGQRRPLVEFSSRPRLRYDPESGIWSNETAQTQYVDTSEIECSRVLRVHEELLHPMWMHLWTEKADFRRSELFRTNEQMLRMSEKESEKLISIGNQFRDDMRATREVLKQVCSELDGKVEQLRGTRDALTSLGLLTDEGARPLSEGALSQLAGGGSDVIHRAEEKETLLALEPQAQAERRDKAVDPIDVIADPINLFMDALPDQLRRVLARPAEVPAHGAEGAELLSQGVPGGDGS
jgi:hypothetical protein